MRNPCADIPLGYHRKMEAIAGSEDLKRAKEAANKVRALAEELNKSMGGNDETLAGWCADCTMLLWSLLPDGIPCRDPNDQHVWLYYKGMIVDVTATQFKLTEDTPIVIRPWNEKLVSLYPFWGKEPVPQEEVEDLWVSAIKYFNVIMDKAGLKEDWVPEVMCRHGMKFEGPDTCPECNY